MVTLLLSVLLALAAMIAVAYPILARARPSSGAETSSPAELTKEEELDELLARRDASFQALRELDFDRQVGKITDADFIAFEGGLKLVAADSLRSLDEWEAQADRELAPELREVELRTRTWRAGGRTCPTCGRAADAADRFCPGCGADLVGGAPGPTAPAGLRCPACGRHAEPGDRFCAGCGQPLQVAGALPAK